VVHRAAPRWWLVLAAAVVATFVALAVVSRAGSGLSGWDQHIYEAFIAWRTPVRSRAFWLFTLIGDDSLMASLTTVTVVLAWAWGRRAFAAAAAGGLIVTWAVEQTAKALVGRARPSQALALIDRPISQSMPSGHAVVSIVFIGLLVYALFRWTERRPLGGDHGRSSAAGAPVAGRAVTALRWAGLIAAVPVVGMIGVSRVYLGVHWLSDVLGGWCLGGAFLIITLRVAARWELTGGPGSRLRYIGPWAARARWTLVGFVVLVVCGVAVLAGWLDPLR
jgi:membrane-associated phospholipid phosphatase